MTSMSVTQLSCIAGENKTPESVQSITDFQVISNKLVNTNNLFPFVQVCIQVIGQSLKSYKHSRCKRCIPHTPVNIRVTETLKPRYGSQCIIHNLTTIHK